MTSFQQITSDFPMVEQHDDIMEDSMYAERQNQGLDDIDVDFEFDDDAAEDAQMVESGSYLEEDATQTTAAAFDRDDEMPDEEQENTVEDHEIFDAPPQVHESAVEVTAAEVLMTEQPNNGPSESITDALVEDMVDYDHQSDVQFQEDGGEQVSRALRFEQLEDQNHNQTETIDASAAVGERDVYVNPDASVSDTRFANEVIGDTPFQASQGGVSSIDIYAATGVRLATAASTDVIRGPGEPASSDITAVMLKKDMGIAPQPSSFEEQAGLDGGLSVLEGADGGVEAPEKPRSDLIANTADPIEQPYRDNTSTIVAISEDKVAHSREHEESVADESTDDADIEELSIVVEYEGQELSLFMPRSDDATDTYLLSDTALVEHDLKALLSACRPVIGAGFPDEEELVIHFPSLGLEIAESAEEATTTSLAQLRDFYLHLSHNDGKDKADALRLELFTKRKISAQLHLLQSLIRDGKGLKDLAQDDLSEQEDDQKEADEANVSVADGFQAGGAAEEDDFQEPHEADTKYNPITEGPGQTKEITKRDETPKPDNLTGKDDLFDFRSPLRQPHENNSEYSGAGPRPHEETEVEFSHSGNQPADAGFDALVETQGDGEADFHHLFPDDSALVQDESHEQRDAFDDTRPDIFYDGAVGLHTLTNNETNGNGVSTRSSTLLEGEDDFTTNDYEQDTKGTNTNSLHEAHTEDAGGHASPLNDDGFDFDEFVRDTDNAAAAELPDDEPTAGSDEVSHTSDPAIPGHDVTLESIGTHQVSAPQTGHVSEKDEIDFSDDDEPEELAEPATSAQSPGQIGTAPKEHPDSLKRSRPHDDEDGEAVADSPSGLKRQRSG